MNVVHDGPMLAASLGDTGCAAGLFGPSRSSGKLLAGQARKASYVAAASAQLMCASAFSRWCFKRITV